MFWNDRGGVKPGTKGATSLPVSSKPIETQLVTPMPVLRASLGPDTAVSGRLSFTVPTRIDGRLRGEVRASDLLVVGEDAVVEGVVRALRLVVGHKFLLEPLQNGPLVLNRCTPDLR